MFKKRKLNEDKLVESILSKVDKNITKESIELILKLELDYLVEIGIARRD
jgi:hypothetical protein